MRFVTFSIFVIFLIIPATFNCNQPHQLLVAKNISGSVSFVDYGMRGALAVAVLTLVNDSIKMDSIQNNFSINYWDTAIATAEFDSIWKIIKENNLVGSTDPVLPDSQSRCWGFNGMVIIFHDSTLVDSIVIRKEVDCPIFWSTGLRSLVAYKDSLVERYQPHR